MAFLNNLNHVSFAASFAPLAAALINIKRINGYLVPLLPLIIVTPAVEIVTGIYMGLGLNNSFILHIYTVVEFIFLSMFYKRFFRSYFKPVIFNVMILLFLIVAYIDLRINGPNTMDSFSTSSESIIFTCYSLFLFYYILKNLLYENLMVEPVFYINTGILLYFAGNFFLFVFGNYLQAKNYDAHNRLWGMIHPSINILYNILLAIGFWKVRAK